MIARFWGGKNRLGMKAPNRILAKTACDWVMAAIKRLFGFEQISLALALGSVAAFSWLVFSNPLPNGGSAVPKFSLMLPAAVTEAIELVDLTPFPRSGFDTFAEDSFQKVTVDHLNDTFSKIGYQLEPKGTETFHVPRLYLASLPSDIEEIRETSEKKSLFFRTVLPLVLKANEEVAAHRERLWRLHYQTKLGGHLKAVDQLWLEGLAEEYGVGLGKQDLQGTITALFKRVDIVPTSLALAQAAEESGWGTSRFAKEGNALFGQWTYQAEAGITPNEREEGADHTVKAFPKLGDAVRAYMRNLNTHRAYGKFRTLRAESRENGEPISGYALADGLEKYSARGIEYIQSIRTIIRTNDLETLDAAILAHGAQGPEI